MTSLKVKFRPAMTEGREGSLCFQLIHKRILRQISCDCRLFPSEWNALTSEVILPEGIDEERRNHLLALQEVLVEKRLHLEDIIAGFDREDHAYTTDQVVESYRVSVSGAGFFFSASRLMRGLEQSGRHATMRTYVTSLRSFMRFRRGHDIAVADLSDSLMVEYEAYLGARGVCANTSSYYMRSLRALYNRLVGEGLSAQRSPFRHVYTGIGKTVKRAVTMAIIRKIKNMALPENSSMDYARDLFMFSFYTRGMSFVDMAYLEKGDLRNGVLAYRRQKTCQQLFVRWERPMQEIVDKYDTTRSPYLLPIIRDTGRDVRQQYMSAEHLVNNRLKKLGQQLGLSITLTTYVARHAWASIARSRNVSLSTISEALGHDSEKTTRIYLTTIHTSAVDKANRMMMKALSAS